MVWCLTNKYLLSYRVASSVKVFWLGTESFSFYFAGVIWYDCTWRRFGGLLCRKGTHTVPAAAMPEHGSMSGLMIKRSRHLKTAGGIFGAWVRKIKKYSLKKHQKLNNTVELWTKENRETIYIRNCLGTLNKAATHTFSLDLSCHKTVMESKVVGSEPALCSF